MRMYANGRQLEGKSVHTGMTDSIEEYLLFRFCAATWEELEGWKSSDAELASQGLLSVSIHLGNQDTALTSKGFSYFIIDWGQPLTVATPCAQTKGYLHTQSQLMFDNQRYYV